MNNSYYYYYAIQRFYNPINYLHYTYPTTYRDTIVSEAEQVFITCIDYKNYQAPIQVMIMALIKSIKKAPTNDTINHARGDGPYFSANACILANPLAVAPIAKPIPPTPSMTPS